MVGKRMQDAPELSWPYRAEGRLWLRSIPLRTNPNGGHDGWTTVCTDRVRHLWVKGCRVGVSASWRAQNRPARWLRMARSRVSHSWRCMVHFSSRPALVVRVGSCTRAGGGMAPPIPPRLWCVRYGVRARCTPCQAASKSFRSLWSVISRAATSASTRVRAGLSAKRARAMCASWGKSVRKNGGACAPTRRSAGRRRHTPHRPYNRFAGRMGGLMREGTAPGQDTAGGSVPSWSCGLLCVC